MSRSLLKRALDAEDELDTAKARIADLESRLRGALAADPTTASRALSWIGRAEIAEALLGDVLRYVDQRSLSATDFPAGWVSRAQAQMKAVEILRRDQAELAESPSGEDYWTTYVDTKGRRGVVNDR